MGIDNYLKIIKEGVFGRDVRQAIHDGMYMTHQVVDENKDLVDRVTLRQDAVEQSTNQMITEMTDKDVISAPEIIAARGGKTTLGQRLDETATQLAQTESRLEDFESTNNSRLLSAERQLEQAATIAEVDVERARINSFTTLAVGSTTGDAELIDGRVGADGVTYPNIGGAIRGQISALDENLDVILKETYSTLSSTLKTQSAPPLRQSGTEGMMIRVSNPKTNIFGVKAWFKVTQPGNVVLGIGNGDKIYDSAIKYFHEDGSGVANIFETACVLNISEAEVGTVIEKYFKFDTPYNVAYENLNIGLWGLGLAYTQTWLSKTQSESIMDFTNVTIDAEHGRYAIHTAYGNYYIKDGVANSDILPAISLINESKMFDANCIENGSINKEKLNPVISGGLDKMNLLDSYTGVIENITKINNSILSSTVTAMPKELSQGGWNGRVIRMKNPKTKIYGVKVMDNDDERTLFVGIGNGDNSLSGTIYLDNSQTVFNKISSFTVSQAESTSLFERYIEFDEPLIIDSESLFVGFWGWSSDKSHMLNCNLEGQLIYRNDDDIPYTSEHPHYMVHYHTKADVYYIQGTADSSQMPVIQLIGEDYVVPYSKITNDIVENPLSKLDYSEDFASIFDTIACIGDSLTAGAVEYSTQGTDPDRFPFSFPGQIQKRLNNKVFNFGHSGASSRTWNQTATIRGYFTNEEYKAKAYIIALGTNDLGIEGSFDGTVTDIDVANYNNNADTSVGNYAKIIQRIREFQPRARIFVMTLPHTRNTFTSVKAASEKIRQIAELLNCYVIDLEKYYIRPTDAEEFRNKYYKGGHLNTVGYKYFSNVVVTYMNYIIEQDPYSFWDVSLIGTDLI